MYLALLFLALRGHAPLLIPDLVYLSPVFDLASLAVVPACGEARKGGPTSLAQVVGELGVACNVIPATFGLHSGQLAASDQSVQYPHAHSQSVGHHPAPDQLDRALNCWLAKLLVHRDSHSLVSRFSRIRQQAVDQRVQV